MDRVRASSERNSKIYRFAVPVLQSTQNWTFHVVVVQGWQRNVQKSLMPVQSCCFAHKTHCVFARRRRRSLVSSLCLEDKKVEPIEQHLPV